MKDSKANPRPADRKIEKEDFARKLGESIRRARVDKGLTQEQLAELAGYYRTYVGFIETGSRLPSAYAIWRLSSALEVSMTELFQDLNLD